VGGAEDRAAAVCEVAEEFHELEFRGGIEAGGGLVEEEDRWACEELDGDADALALAAGEIGDASGGVVAQAKLGHGLDDELAKLEGRGAGGKAEAGGEVEGLGDGKLGMDDLRLGDKAPVIGAAAGRDGNAIDRDEAGGGRGEAGKDGKEGGFAGAAGADDADETGGGDIEGDNVEEGAGADDATDVAGMDAAAGEGIDGMEGEAVEQEIEGAELETVADHEGVLVEAAAIGEGAGAALEIDDVEAVRVADDEGVMAGDGGGIEDEAALGVAADGGVLAKGDDAGGDAAIKNGIGGGGSGGDGGGGAFLKLVGSGHGTGIEEELNGAEGENIAGLEGGAGGDGDRADAGAPLAAEVADPNGGVVAFDLAMVAGDFAVVEADIGLGGATEDEVAGGKGEGAEGEAGEDEEVGGGGGRVGGHGGGLENG